MKHLKEKDLSLDKQEVSELGGTNGTNYFTDGCTNPTEPETTLDSHEPPCCAMSDDNDTCGKTCQITYSAVDDTCVISDEPGCITPITETKDFQCE